MDEVLAGFIRGQGLVCLFLALFYGVGLWLVGLRYGLIIGLLTGFFSFIPYIGMTLGLAVGLAVAAFQFQDLVMIGLVLAIFALGQFIEGNLISPRLVGSRIHLHPVWVIFAVLAGTVWAGFLGTLLAVPVAAVIGVLLRFGLERYRASALYGRPPPAAWAGARRVSAAEQLLLGFAHEAASGVADFMPAESNRAALAWLARWPAWPAPALVSTARPAAARATSRGSGPRAAAPAGSSRRRCRDGRRAPRVLDPADAGRRRAGAAAALQRVRRAAAGICC